ACLLASWAFFYELSVKLPEIFGVGHEIIEEFFVLVADTEHVISSSVYLKSVYERHIIVLKRICKD
ncbi:hypothetical protein, partial [Megasphaera sp.]|uniref:hypothetical protein n=1 Tax=Megasphaera sp. TaxID=2023260 RepID=UPI0026724803